MTDDEKVPITDPPAPEADKNGDRAAISQQAEKVAKAFANGGAGPEQRKTEDAAGLEGLPDGVTEEIIASATAMERKVAPTVRQVFGTCLRGMLVSAPGVPSQVLLAVVAWQMGNLLATAFQADLTTTLMIRKNLKEGFADGIAKAPISQPPMPGVPQKLHG